MQGLIGAIELVKEKETKQPFDASRILADLSTTIRVRRSSQLAQIVVFSGAMAAKVVQFALERGLIVRVLPNDVVSICPPLIVAASEGIQPPAICRDK